jgi:hypothetical protein
MNPLLARVGIVGLNLVLLGVAWQLLGLDLLLVGAIALVIVVVGVVPARWSALTQGVGLLLLALLLKLHYGADRMAILIAVIGLVVLVLGVFRLRSTGRPTQDQPG